MPNSTSTPTIISSSALSTILDRKKKTNGIFTLRSIATGKDYTYKVSRSEFKGKWYTHIAVEKGYTNFVRLGSYYGGRITNKRQLVTTPASQAIGFVLGKVEAGAIAWLDSKMELMHMGKCVACGRALTDAVSIQSGLGPICGGR